MNDDLDPLAIPHFRDFVAVSALGGLLSNTKFDYYPDEELARKSYRIADAFLKERNLNDTNPA
jgi:hypothetical protein